MMSVQYLIEQVLQGADPNTLVSCALFESEWHAPDLKSEKGEIVRTAKTLGLSPRKIMKAAKSSALSQLGSRDWSKMQNTDSWSTTSLDKARGLASTYKRDILSIEKAFDKKSSLPAPIVLKQKGKDPYLIGGNTRLMTARAKGVVPKVLTVHI